MVNLYVCKICGEPYLGGSAPDDCPFCGAQKIFIKPVDEFEELWKTDLSELEKSDLRETLDLEINATAYYLDVSNKNKKYSKENRLFKQIARVEKEHAEIAVKFLGVELPEIEGETSKGSIEEDLKRTIELEQGAIANYKGFLKNATSTNVQRFYTAIIYAEEGHRKIADKELP